MNEVRNIYDKDFLQEIRQIVDLARQKAYSAINSAMVEAYWQIGKRIFEYNASYVFTSLVKQSKIFFLDNVPFLSRSQNTSGLNHSLFTYRYFLFVFFCGFHFSIYPKFRRPIVC